jgi:hypothetical protein
LNENAEPFPIVAAALSEPEPALDVAERPPVE